MNGWIVDTNVLSELRKPRCDPRVRAWTQAQPNALLYISCVTLAEIRAGIDDLTTDEAFRGTLQTWLDGTLRPWFAGRILDIDETVMLAWRRLVAAGKAQRHTFPQPDLFIAATAAVHGLGVATRNVADFTKAGVLVVDPWKPA